MALVEGIAKYYADDLPSPATLQHGIADGNVSKTVIFQVHHLTPVTNKAMFPNIHTLLCIICTLPVTSCECKRFVCCAALKPFCSLPWEEKE